VLDYICEHVKKANSDEVITIYRGEGTKSLPFDKSYSWTTDIDTAIWFASKGVGKAVYEAKVHKSDIIFSTNKRHENEVIVRPEDVYGVRRLSMHPCEDDQFVVACTQKHIEKCKKYVPLLKKLYPENRDGVHGISHVCRVLLFCFMIADEIRLEQRDTELLALAAVYHDCCRTHDGVDTVHGSTSAEKFLNSNDGKYLDREYQSYVYNAIKYHSLNDEVGVEAIWKDKRIGERLRAIRIHDILKDADALDRFRLGRPHSGGGTFEYKYLRRMESKQLVLLAAYLVNMNIDKIILKD